MGVTLTHEIVWGLCFITDGELPKFLQKETIEKNILVHFGILAPETDIEAYTYNPRKFSTIISKIYRENFPILDHYESGNFENGYLSAVTIGYRISRSSWTPKKINMETLKPPITYNEAFNSLRTYCRASGIPFDMDRIGMWLGGSIG